MSQSLIDRATSISLTLAALAIAAALVRREFFPAADHSDAANAPVFIEDWESFVDDGILQGPSSAKIIVTEFVDFECPVCAMYEKTLQGVVEKFPGVVSRLSIHFPLSEIHSHSLSAAVAVDCAHEQGRFAQMSNTIFSKQDSLGSLSWSDLARRSEVVDSIAFKVCFTGPTPPRVTRGIELAKELNLRGTPTIIVNGWKYAGGLPESALISVIENTLAGKTPRGVKP